MDAREQTAVEDEITRLAAGCYEAMAGDIRKDRDAHWQIAERWSYGEWVGWFVEHDGYRYDGLQFGEGGPHPTREAAERCLAEHLRTATAEAREHGGG